MRSTLTRRLEHFVLIVSGLLAFAAASSEAQTPNLPNWSAKSIFNKALAVGTMDSSVVVDMTNHRNLTLRVKVDPIAGVAEPWAIVDIRAIGSTKAYPDSNSTGIMHLQPVADHSYSGSAAGDSLAYGAWVTGTATDIGNGIMEIRGARPNSAFPYPHAWFFELGNKGQAPRTQYVYFQVFMSASGAGGSPRVELVVEKSN